MRIRGKLLWLLGLVAVLPAVLTILLDVQVIRSLSRDLTTRTAEALGEQALLTMNLIASEYADVLERETRRVRLLVTLQADAAEQALAAPPSAAHGPAVFYDEAFDNADPALELDIDGAPRIARMRRGGKPLAVAWDVVSLHAVRGVERATHADDARALASMTAFYQRVRERNDALLGWHYVVLANGISASYPGHGGNPPDFDPRARHWFADQLQNPGFRWYRPHHDASTGTLLINAAMPVRDTHGAVIGVAGIDVDLSSSFKLLELPAPLRAGSEILAAAVVRPPFVDTPRVVVLARQHADETAGDWQAMPALSTLELGTASDAIRSAMLAGQDGRRRTLIDGAEHYVLLRRFGAIGAYVVMTVPVATAAQPAIAAARDAARATRQHLHGLLLLVLAATVLAAGVAIAASHHLSRPITDLHDAVLRLASGDFGARAALAGNDEIGTLGRAFDAMVPQLKEHARVEDALALAREIQQRLLPSAPPQVPGWDIAGTTLYSEQTGGDFFDYLDLLTPDGPRLGIIVADVSGHGIGPALLMANTRALLHAQRDRRLAPGALLERVNRELAQDVSRGHFVTLFLLNVETASGTLAWASAGHDAALVWRASQGTADELSADDIPLGIDGDWRFESAGGQTLAPGDIVVLGTDGVWDTARADGERFGKRRLHDFIASHAEADAATLCHGLEDALATFRGDGPQVDDVTLVVIKRTG